MLESLGVTNIGSLNLEEPLYHEPLFDPEAEISLPDWNHMKDYLREQKISSQSDMYFVQKAVSMKILFPERFNELDMDNEKIVDQTKRYIFGMREGIDPYTYSQWCMRFKILYPERIREINLTEKNWSWFKAGYEKQLKEDDFWEAGVMATNLFIVDPEKARQLDLLSNPLSPKQQEMFEYFADVHRYVLGAFFYKILFPDSSKSGLDLSQSQLKRERNLLKELRTRGSWGTFIEAAADFKVVTAERITVTQQGLDITMPKMVKPLTEPIPALPEVRKF